MNNIKYFICGMSTNIIDSIIEMESNQIGLLATRRQIDYNGGYVNNWKTKNLYEYVRSKSNITLQRDHAGANQGNVQDDGYLSFLDDVNYFDLIHIDPWKVFNSKLDGILETIKNIEFISKLNPKIKFEIGTEQDILKFTTSELEMMLSYLKKNLSNENWNNIEYVVIQSGVSLDLINRKNVGYFDINRLKDMINAVKNFGKKSKEHNGDYLTDDEYKFRFNNGLDVINIGPEFAQIETDIYLENMTNKQIDEFYKICLNSNKWKRWVKKDINELTKKELIQVCGHYNYNQYNLPKVDNLVKQTIRKKLENIL